MDISPAIWIKTNGYLPAKKTGESYEPLARIEPRTLRLFASHGGIYPMAKRRQIGEKGAKGKQVCTDYTLSVGGQM